MQHIYSALSPKLHPCTLVGRITPCTLGKFGRPNLPRTSWPQLPRKTATTDKPSLHEVVARPIADIMRVANKQQNINKHYWLPTWCQGHSHM